MGILTSKKENKDGLEIIIPHTPRKRERQRAMHTAPRKTMSYVHTNVPRDKAFLTIDGRHILNLLELTTILEQMDDHAFAYHANTEKNDFSNWIRDVMGNTILAETIRDKSRQETQIEVLKHIVKELA